MTTELDQLENKVLTKLEPPEKSKGSLSIPDRKGSMDHAKPPAKSDVRSRLNASKTPAFEKTIPEESEVGVSAGNRSKEEDLRNESMESLKRHVKADSVTENQDPKRMDSGFGSFRPRLSSWRRKSSAVGVKEIKSRERPKSIPLAGSPPVVSTWLMQTAVEMLTGYLLFVDISSWLVQDVSGMDI